MEKSQTACFALLLMTSFSAACGDDTTTTGDSGMTADATADSPTSEGSSPDGMVGDATTDVAHGNDGGADAVNDATADALADGGTDGGGGDGGTDGGSEARADAGTDSGTEAAADTGVDAGPDVIPAPGIVGLPGYTVTVFATGGTTYAHPDSLELDGTHVWVGYNMGVKSKDGSTDGGGPLNSMVVEYNLDGSLAGKSFAIPGHCDGVRVNPVTHVVWATSNEDGNPIVMSFDPATSTPTTYTFAAPPGHGGGLDDMAFVGGQFVVADSSPSADDAGVISVPVLSAMHVSGTTISFTPLLMGNDMAFNPYSGATSALNITDPDSMSIDNQGNLVLVDQGDSQLLVITNLGASGDAGVDAGADGSVDGGGSPQQSVTVYPVATQLDDTVWATKATGMLLVADETLNTIYAVHAAFTPGTIYTETPNDSSLPGIVGTLDLAGQPQPGPMAASVTPIVLGLKKPTGLIFVAQ